MGVSRVAAERVRLLTHPRLRRYSPFLTRYQRAPSVSLRSSSFSVIVLVRL